MLWRATFSKAGPTLVNDGLNLTRELVQTAGSVLCERGRVVCEFHVETRDDQVSDTTRGLVL